MSSQRPPHGWLARLREVIADRKPMPWNRKPLPLVLFVLLSATFAGCTENPESRASLTQSLGVEDPAGSPVAVIEIGVEQPPVAPGEEVLFDGSDSEGAISVWSWSFGDDSTSVERDPLVEHAYAESGEYVVVLLVRDEEGREDFDVTRITVVARAGAEEEADVGTAEPEATTADEAGAAEVHYVWEEPKYSAPDVFESLTVSTIPAKDTPYAASVGGTWVHADFAPEDRGMLLDGLVIYQDFTGQELCPDRNAKVSNWLYDAGGHYYGQAQECGLRAGVATQVYVGLCVEFDGELVPAEDWVRVGDVVYGDKMDECWTRILKIPS